jgi:hypothetical protein
MSKQQQKSVWVLSIAIGLAFSVSAGSAHAAEVSSLRLNGFVDAQVQSTTSQQITRGFMVNDGAIYLTTAAEGIDFLADLPFRLVTGGSPNFEFATIKAQAYIGQKYANGIRWKLGQFDTPYGFEANDTHYVAFTRQGSVYNFTDPFVHTGLQLSYVTANLFSVNLVVGAPRDTGPLKAGTNPEFGAQVALLGDLRFSLGGLASKSSANDKFSYYVDATAGINLGSLSIDAEVNYQRRQGESTTQATSPYPAGTELPAGIGSLLHVVYNLNEGVSFGARGEYVTKLAKKDPRAVAGQDYLDKQILVFVGPQFGIAKDMRLKVDYSFQRDEEYSGTIETIHGGQAAVVYKF